MPTQPRGWSSPTAGLNQPLLVENYLGAGNAPDQGQIARRTPRGSMVLLNRATIHVAECCGRTYCVPVGNPCPYCRDHQS